MFHRNNTIILFLLLTVKLFATSPTMPYSFYGPYFNTLLPFTQDELATLTKEGIKRVGFKTIGSKGETVYYISNGKVQKSNSYDITKKGKVYTDSTFYTYNEKGKIIHIHSFGKRETCDSIVYNKEGSVVYYLAYSLEKISKKKTEKYIQWELSHNPTILNAHCLVMKDSIRDYTYVLDQNNDVIRFENQYMIDSIARVETSNGEYSLKYFINHKNVSYSGFRLGQEYIYKNGRLVSYKQYETYNTDNWAVKTISYLYNEQGQLLQEFYGKYSSIRTFYSYREDGLLEYTVKLDSQGAITEQINYYYK